MIKLNIRYVLILAISWWLAPLDNALAQAKNSITCKNGTTMTASVPGGTCTTAGHTIQCKNSAGDTALADCDLGACNSEGNGTCDRTDKARGPVSDGGTTKTKPIKTAPISAGGIKN
jgi:hypothetical protein